MSPSCCVSPPEQRISNLYQPQIRGEDDELKVRNRSAHLYCTIELTGPWSNNQVVNARKSIS